MTRILHSPSFEQAAVDVPAPHGWDSVALAAYERGFQEGAHVGRDAGRRDILIVSGQVDRCLQAIDAASRQLNNRVIEVAELFVSTVLRHIPEARTAGLLVRLGEVLASFDPGAIVVAVHPHDLESTLQAVAHRTTASQSLSVVSDRSLNPGEFRVQSEWANAEGTFDRYFAAAREALELYLAVDPT